VGRSIVGEILKPQVISDSVTGQTLVEGLHLVNTLPNHNVCNSFAVIDAIGSSGSGH
jgi:hypothetical protein